MPCDRPHVRVSQSDFFRRKVDRLRANYPRIDEYVAGAIWLLERAPELGDMFGEPLGAHRALNAGPKMSGLPRMRLAYIFRNGVVELEDILLYDDDGGDGL